MALSATVSASKLDAGLILAPERYDPRRYQINTKMTIADVALEIRELINPTKKSQQEHFLVLDTGDAHEGFIMTNKQSMRISEIGSTKKVVQPSDVIISRLRPYLRQIALIDQGLVESMPKGTAIACSTEFYVLRSKTARSIAFLIPILLSGAAQELLCAAQEGGHHPRFNLTALETIAIPDHLLENRDEVSLKVVSALSSMRSAKSLLSELIHYTETENKRPIWF